jgi:Putative binding domain, N-terminal
MKRFVSSEFSQRARITCSAALFLVFATACSDNPAGPSGSSGGGCQVITGNTTTSFSAAGGSSSVSIRTAANCTWGAVSSASFLTVTQGASGSGDGSIQFAVAANTGAQRTATLTVTDSETTIADTVIALTQSAQ